jgi:hypothetical protein
VCVFLGIRLGFYLCLDTGCSNRNSDLIQSLKNVSVLFASCNEDGISKVVFYSFLDPLVLVTILYIYENWIWEIQDLILGIFCCNSRNLWSLFLSFLLLEVHHSKKWFVALCGGSNISSVLSDWLFLWLGGSWHPLQNVRGLQCVNGLENLKFSIVYMLTRFMSPF